MYQPLTGYCLASLLLFISLSIPAYQIFAQAGQAELTGEVRDAAGLLIARATVMVTEVNTGEVITATTGKSGVFTVTNLRPGLYTVTVSAADFRRVVREGVKLTTGDF